MIFSCIIFYFVKIHNQDFWNELFIFSTCVHGSDSKIDNSNSVEIKALKTVFNAKFIYT